MKIITRKLMHEIQFNMATILDRKEYSSLCHILDGYIDRLLNEEATPEYVLDKMLTYSCYCTTKNIKRIMLHCLQSFVKEEGGSYFEHK